MALGPHQFPEGKYKATATEIELLIDEKIRRGEFQDYGRSKKFVIAGVYNSTILDLIRTKYKNAGWGDVLYNENIEENLTILIFFERGSN
jgi:hypothetical protein